MRINQLRQQANNIRILALDDDKNMTFSLQAYFQALGYYVDIENEPNAAIERIRNEHYDILILDYLMMPVNGERVVSSVREFNSEIYIILLTGHKDMVPPIQTIRELDIQGYFEKSERYDNLALLVESCVKSLRQLKTIRQYQYKLSQINSKLTQTNQQLLAFSETMVNTLRLVVDAKDIYTSGHSDRVSKIAEVMAKHMGKDKESVDNIRLSGLFHDIGKIKVPDSILLSCGKLTEEEYAVMKEHSQYGFEILRHVDFMKDLLPGIRSHHERYDGMGYPDRLVGKQIPECARIISIADAFDAMTSERNYRKSLELDVAIQEIIKNKDKQFDSQLVDVFMDCLPRIIEIITSK